MDNKLEYCLMLRRFVAILGLALTLPVGLGIDTSGKVLLLANEARAQSGLKEVVEQSKLKEILDKLTGAGQLVGFAQSNGRIEATQVDAAAKYAGRLDAVPAKEGDEVAAGQVVARISSPEYEAQLRGAQSQVLRAKQAFAEVEALIAQRESELKLAQIDLERGKQLLANNVLPKQNFDQRASKAESAEAALRAARAQREQAEFAVHTAEADVDRIEAILVDLTLVAPRSGRVQYKLAQAGEVVAAGQRILTILDLSDVYMTIYLPAAQAGLLALGDDARIIIDPLPDYVIPATVSFVAADAQFTPKSVETADEREKLMFRIKLQVDPDVLRKYHTYVKTGIRGIGYIRTAPNAEWPDALKVKLPQ